MPLIKSKSRAAMSENIRRERTAGKPERQVVAIALSVQRQAGSQRRRSMPENSSHAPGGEAKEEGGPTRQRHMMGKGEGPMSAGSFGVGSLPGTRTAQNHGSAAPHDGVMLHDDHRAGPPAIDQGNGNMRATAHSKHGPHDHDETKMPGGTRGHHVGGAASTRGGK